MQRLGRRLIGARPARLAFTAALLILAAANTVRADMRGRSETMAEAQQRRLKTEQAARLADISPYYRRLQENSERTVLILRADNRGPEALPELIEALDSIMNWFIARRGGNREWFVNFEWGGMSVGAQFLLRAKDAPPPFTGNADGTFSKFAFAFAPEKALSEFSQWCRAGGAERVTRPCAEAMEQAVKRGLAAR